MKIVEDYIDFEAYKSIANSSVLPIFEKAVNDVFEDKELIGSTKRKRKIAIILFIVAALVTVISLIILFTTGKSQNVNAQLISGFVILFISLVFLGIGFGFYFSYIKSLKLIVNKIKSSFNIEKIYNDSFKKTNIGLDYLSTEKNLNDYLKSEKFDQNEILSNSISENEIRTYSYGVPRTANLIEISDVKFMLIDDKYPSSFVNSLFREVETNSKGEIVKEYLYNRGLLKIDTRRLGDRAFDFSLFKGSTFFGQKPIRLENNEFNKKIGIVTNDELKARQMYTPLSMELSLKRLKDTSGSIVKRMSVTSTSDAIYFEYTAPMNFMKLDIKESLNSKVILNSMYKDFLYDTYTLYWILSMIYIPLYLDK